MAVSGAFERRPSKAGMGPEERYQSGPSFGSALPMDRANREGHFWTAPVAKSRVEYPTPIQFANEGYVFLGE